MGLSRQASRTARGRGRDPAIPRRQTRARFFHARSLVESKQIGPGTRVWAFAHIMPGSRVGRDCNIGEGCYLENGCVIGDRVTIKNGVAIWDGVTLEDDVFVGPQVGFTNDAMPRSKAYLQGPSKTLVRRGASLGAHATVLCGITIGEHSMVGAGAVVTKNVPAFGLVYGNPSRLHGHVCLCTRKLMFGRDRAVCLCGRRFVLKGGAVGIVGDRSCRETK